MGAGASLSRWRSGCWCRGAPWHAELAACRGRLIMGRWIAAYGAVLIVALLIAAAPLRAIDLGEGSLLLLADQMTYDSEAHVVTATGNVDVTRGERRLLADVLRY